MIENPPIQVFLSYSRKDDKEFHVVNPLVAKLQALVLAKSGRPLRIFVDKIDIQWGANWRERLDVEIENALLFIPLLSANYLLSEACRAEFLAFHSKATALKVTELILPILLFESPLFAPNSTDDVVRLAEARQWKLIEDAVLAGGESPAFITTAADLAGSLITSLAKAEQKLVESATQKGSSTQVAAPDSDGDGEGNDGEGGLAVGPGDKPSPIDPGDVDLPSGLAELMLRLENAVNMMTEAANRLGPAIERLGSSANDASDLPESPTHRDILEWSTALARTFVGPARDLETSGKELFHAVNDADGALEGLRVLAASAEDTPFGASINGGIADLVVQLGDMSEVEVTLSQLLASMRPAELVSVPMRTALQPARRGLTAVTDSLRLIRSWSGAGAPLRNNLTSAESRPAPQDHHRSAVRSQPRRSRRKDRR